MGPALLLAARPRTDHRTGELDDGTARIWDAARCCRPLWRSLGIFEYLGDGLGLVGLRPVRGALDHMQFGAAEQAGEMAGEAGAEVLIGGAVDERDGHVEGSELAAGDAGVLVGQRAEQGPGPGPD